METKYTIKNVFANVSDILAQTEKSTLFKVSETKGLWVANKFIGLTKKDDKLVVGICMEMEYTITDNTVKDNSKDIKALGELIYPDLPFSKPNEINLSLFRKPKSK